MKYTWHGSVRDPQRKMVFTVYAFRPLTEPELRQVVELFRRNNARKLKAGTKYDILTTIGNDA